MSGRAVVAIGEAAPLVRDALSDLVPVVTADSMADAVTRGYGLAAPDGVVLLAPACASFDQFTSFEDRGYQFRALAQEIAGQSNRNGNSNGGGNGNYPRRAVGRSQ